MKGEIILVRIELIELTDTIIRYKFFPEDKKKYGIVALDRQTGRRILEKEVKGYPSSYAAHAFHRIEEYQNNNDFPKEDIVAWY